MKIDAQLWQIYRVPNFKIETQLDCDSFAILTAWNPASELRSREENLKNNALLLADVRDCPHAVLTCGDADFSWYEESFAIEISAQQALSLGQKYGQNAIYYVSGGDIFLLSCLSDNTKERLGRFEHYCILEQ